MCWKERRERWGWEKEESRLMRSYYYLDYVARNEVFCVGEVIVEAICSEVFELL